MTPDYVDLVTGVLYDGEDVSPRGIRCYEERDVSVTFDAGELVSRPGANRALGYMELLQLLAGEFAPEALKRVAPKADHSLFTYNMAYGPRLLTQMLPVLKELRADSTSRRAVLYFASPGEARSKLPCTETVQFLIRGDCELETYVSMRSWDLVKGLTYDVAMFGGLALAFEMMLGCGVMATKVRVNAKSAHVYEADEDLVESLGSGQERRFTLDRNKIAQYAPAGHGVERALCALQNWAHHRIVDETWTKGAPEGVVQFAV